MIRLIAFDLDGTLIDSRRDLADSANALLAQHGAPPLATDAIIGMVGEGAKILVSRVLAAAQLTAVPIDDALAQFIDIYSRRLVDHTRPYAGVEETVRTLASSCRLAVLTNKPRGPAVEILEHFALMPFFADVIGGDGPLPRKPDPRNLLALCGQSRITPSEALIVGDSWVDVETGRAAGASVCFVEWGFGQPPREGLRDGEWRIDRPEGLLEIVLTHADRLNEGPLGGVPAGSGHELD